MKQPEIPPLILFTFYFAERLIGGKMMKENVKLDFTFLKIICVVIA